MRKGGRREEAEGGGGGWPLGVGGPGGRAVVLVRLRPLLTDVGERLLQNLYDVIRGVNALHRNTTSAAAQLFDHKKSLELLMHAMIRVAEVHLVCSELLLAVLE